MSATGQAPLVAPWLADPGSFEHLFVDGSGAPAFCGATHGGPHAPVPWTGEAVCPVCSRPVCPRCYEIGVLEQQFHPPYPPAPPIKKRWWKP